MEDGGQFFAVGGGYAGHGPGLSVRDAMALGFTLAKVARGCCEFTGAGDANLVSLADSGYRYADAMIRRRNDSNLPPKQQSD